ncbi:hypothetical protein ID866_8557 [Astraeus odoratus]|nr:hypothetical protein ID866_8557 [Astraeus odoratus]
MFHSEALEKPSWMPRI